MHSVIRAIGCVALIFFHWPFYFHTTHPQEVIASPSLCCSLVLLLSTFSVLHVVNSFTSLMYWNFLGNFKTATHIIHRKPESWISHREYFLMCYLKFGLMLSFLSFIPPPSPPPLLKSFNYLNSLTCIVFVSDGYISR